MSNNGNFKMYENLAYLSQIGFMMAVPIIGCLLFGIFLDGKLNTGYLFLFIFTIMGVIASFRNLYVFVMKKSREQEQDHRRKRY